MNINLLCEPTDYVQWIDQDGNCYKSDCKAHAITAEKILKMIYKVENDIYNADDMLYEKGWIKVTTSNMYYYYTEDGMYSYLTEKQQESFDKWRIQHHMPDIQLPRYV